MTLEEEIKQDLAAHPLDRNPAVLARAMERISDLDKKLDQAIDMLGDGARAALLIEWSKDS